MNGVCLVGDKAYADACDVLPRTRNRKVEAPFIL